MAIDHHLNPGKYTKEQLKQNASEAEAAANVAAAKAAANVAAIYHVTHAAAKAADYAAIHHVAYAAASAAIFAASAGRLIDEYFKRSKESKQDYIDEINRGK